MFTINFSFHHFFSFSQTYDYLQELEEDPFKEARKKASSLYSKQLPHSLMLMPPHPQYILRNHRSNFMIVYLFHFMFQFTWPKVSRAAATTAASPQKAIVLPPQHILPDWVFSSSVVKISFFALIRLATIYGDTARVWELTAYSWEKYQPTPLL